MDKRNLKYNMWQQQQQQQQQQAYLRSSSSQYPQQQAVHPVAIISPDNRAHQQLQQHHQQQYQQHHAAVMNLPSNNNSRASRNIAEKQRRDNLNAHIARIAELVPIVATSTKKLDKISVLRLACAFLRTQYTIGKGLENFLPWKFNDFDLEQFFMDCLTVKDAFHFIVTSSGKIVYVSKQVDKILGYFQNDMLSKSMYDFVYPDDHPILMKNITPDGMKMEPPESPRSSSRISESMHDNNSSSSDDSTSFQVTRESLFNLKRTFQIRIAQRIVPNKRENPQYEYFEVSGKFRLAYACSKNFNGNKERYREAADRSRITTNDIIFIGMAEVFKKSSITALSILDVNKDEYVTRHLIDGRIIYCDHRVSFIAGYMSTEVAGESAFKYMHKDDFRWTMVGLRQMYDSGKTWGSSCYRLLTKAKKFIYLRTHGYLELDKNTQTVESFICINTLVSEEEGIRLIQEMKESYSAIASTTTLIPSPDVDVSSSIELCLNLKPKALPLSTDCGDIMQIENAVCHLISDLASPSPSSLPSPSPSSTSEDFLSLSSCPDPQYIKAAMFASRMPPVATHINKIKNIKHNVIKIKGKGKDSCIASKQYNDHKYTIGKYMSPSKAEESPISDSESTKPSGKSIKMLDMMETAQSNRGNGQNADVPTQSNIFAAHKPANSCVSCSGISYMDAPQASNTQERMKQQSGASMLPLNALQGGSACNIKVECAVETFNCREKQKSVLPYFDDSASDSSIVSASVKPHTTNRGMLKRICSDEYSMTRKKRHGVAYASTNTDEEQQDVSRIKCRDFASEKKYPMIKFNRYNDVNSQSLMTAESPNSSLHEVGADYQQLDSHGNPLIVTNVDEEQFMQDLQDMKDNALLSPDLDTTPELMMKLLNGFPNESATNFKDDFNESNAQQFALEDQMVNEELRRKHIHLSEEQMLRESQINVLAQELKDPAFRVQRENLSLLQAELKMQGEMLKTLQQDHRKIQPNVKYFSMKMV